MSAAARRALIALAVVAAASARASEPSTPYRVAVSVRWGSHGGSEAFRADLARRLAGTLECFARVELSDEGRAAPDADLLLEVVLSDLLEETRYDDTISDTLQSEDPAHELRREARFEVTMDATLATRATGTVVRRKHARAHAARRPVFIGEDPQEYARAEAVDGIIRDVRKAACRDGAKLAREVAAALGASAGEPPKR